nr:NAD(P)-dependent oxidoreductase [Rhodococcus sp. SBT000017]
MTDTVSRVLITGAAGNMGAMLRPLLAAPGRMLRLFDIAEISDIDSATEEFVQGSVTDRAAVAAAVDGVDAIVHLGGLSTEDSWANILSVNVDGTQAVFEAAVTHGVTRVVVASSNHAVGFWTHDEAGGEPLPGTPLHDPTASTGGARPQWKPWAGCTTTASASTSSISVSARASTRRRTTVAWPPGCPLPILPG